MRSYIAVLLLFFILPIGCTKKQAYQNIYEGLRTREKIVYPDAPDRTKPYDEYELDRKRYLEKESK